MTNKHLKLSTCPEIKEIQNKTTACLILSSSCFLLPLAFPFLLQDHWGVPQLDAGVPPTDSQTSSPTLRLWQVLRPPGSGREPPLWGTERLTGGQILLVPDPPVSHTADTKP